MKKVSIIIPLHNNEKHLKECIDSVLNQTYKNLEIIIVDDKSTDNSLDIIRGIEDKRIRILSFNENVGAALARNKGIREAKGDYISFLDADDYWVLDKIEKQLKFMKKKKCVFSYSSYLYYRDGKIHQAKVPKSITYDEALKNTAIFTSTVMFDMKKLSKDDIYMPNIKRGQDTATWWKVLKMGVRAYGIEEPLCIYRVGRKSLSSNKVIALKRTWTLYNREHLNFFYKSYCFSCYVVNAIKRRVL